MRQALLIPMLVMGWLLAASTEPSWGQQHQCGTVGGAIASSGEKNDILEAMEAFNKDREKACQDRCKKQECDKKPCRAVGDDADATCSVSARGSWECSDLDFNCKCTCDPPKDKGCPDREVAASDSEERGCKKMAELACEAACEKGKCSPAGKEKVECESEQVDVVCKEHKAVPFLWYDEKVLCDCDCPKGPDKED